MRIRIIAFLLLVAFGCLTSYAQTRKEKSSQSVQEESTIRVNTALVNVPVAVLDRDGKFISNLRLEDFQLFEDDIAQEITHFKNVEEPMTVALLLDVSDSAKIKFEEIKQAAIAFVDQLRPQDHALVIVFDQSVTVMAEATDDKDRLRAAINRIRSGSGTSIYDAIDLTFNQQLSKVQGRKAVVIFSDGVDINSARATYQSTLQMAEEQDAPIYIIHYNTYDAEVTALQRGAGTIMMKTPKGESLKLAFDRGAQYLQLLSSRTGGRFYYADKLENLKQSFARIAEELKQQYLLGYYPNNQSQSKTRREIKVKVGIPKSNVRARKSYVYRTDSGEREKN